jgi:hypothetical protein
METKETQEPDSLRDQAIGRLRKKEEFRTHALVYVTVNVMGVALPDQRGLERRGR